MSITIALVDDQALIRSGLKALLESFGGIEVQTEAENWEILCKSRTKKTAPDICIISSSAFMRNNGQAIEAIKQKFPKSRVLILCRYTSEYAITSLLRARVNGVLLQSAKPDELKKAVFAIYRTGTCWPLNLLVGEDREDPYPKTSMVQSQVRFLELCLEDLTLNEIGKKMGVTNRTVQTYRDTLFQRFRVSSRSSLVLFAIKNGLLELK